ncbi:hypothetical protein ABHF33_00815 [Chitinibacter sp. FCG-7]|uniref:Uncharacterized protein n=1 Tax=Chitinibacter mangrovi TaxID=3153927 RepID=A0AAU7FAM7_9NEIS
MLNLTHSLLAASLLSPLVFAAEPSYAPATGMLEMPHVNVGGTWYAAKLQQQDDGRFSLLEASPTTAPGSASNVANSLAECFANLPANQLQGRPAPAGKALKYTTHRVGSDPLNGTLLIKQESAPYRWKDLNVIREPYIITKHDNTVYDKGYDHYLVDGYGYVGWSDEKYDWYGYRPVPANKYNAATLTFGTIQTAATTQYYRSGNAKTISINYSYGGLQTIKTPLGTVQTCLVLTQGSSDGELDSVYWNHQAWLINPDIAAKFLYHELDVRDSTGKADWGVSNINTLRGFTYQGQAYGESID